MLLTKDLINGVNEKYVDMLKTVNIPDFTKCIAEFSGLPMDKVDDKMIKEYLQTWAENKYRFYQMLGNKTKFDTKIRYKRIRSDLAEEMKELGKDFPAYFLWLEELSNQTSNKIDEYKLRYDFKYAVRRLFENYKLEGSTITHFFKAKLNAPDELVTKIASIFENDTVEANYTISIDPVDIMTASENPYDWQSCYRLESENCESHADGCMAAILDTTSLITYIWRKEGKLNLYNEYELKSVRYKMMREWIAISANFTGIHFNSIYPGKNYDEEFERLLRNEVESLVSNYLKMPNKWRRAERAWCDRQIGYGYSEFSSYRIYVLSTIGEDEEENIKVYDTMYHCACGCGEFIPPSYDDESMEYEGNGFRHDCMTERYYCEYCDDYCSHECCREECEGCSIWNDNHPVCSLDTCEECEDIPDYYWEGWVNGEVEAREDHCINCPRWQECHANDEDCESEEE